MINQPQTIIHSLAGHKVPKELFETASTKCPTASGFAVRDNEHGNITLESDRFNRSVTVENLETLNGQTEKFEAIYFLANIPGEHTIDDVQPFTLTILESEDDKIGKDILSVFIEGDLPKFVKDGHTEEYNFYNDIVLPTLQDMYMAADQDMAAFIASLHKPLFEKQMMAHFGHRGVMLFLPLEGDVIKFGSNELGKGYDWGSCSQHLDFEKASKPITTAAAAVTSAVKKFNPFAKGEPAPTGVHSTTATAKPLNEAVEKTATAITAGKTLVKPPQGLDKSARNRWLRLMNNGDLPPQHDHKGFEGVWVTPDVLPYAKRTDVKTLAQVDALGAEMRSGIKKQPVIPQPIGSKSPADFLPTLSDAEMTDLTGTLAKFIDRDKVPSALEIQKMEAPWPVFSEKAGIPFADTFRWTVSEANSLGHKALVLLWLETRRKLMEKTDVSELVGTVKKETDKHVEAKQILAPDGTVAKTVPTTAADKRAALFGLKKTA